MAKPETYPVVLLRPELSLLWFTLPMLGLGLLLAITGWSLMFGMVFGWAGAALSFRFGRSKGKPTRIPGQLAIDERAITFRRARIAERRWLRAGILVPTGDDLVVRLTRVFPLGSIDLEVRSDDDGHAVLRELGFDTTQRVASFQLGSLATIRRIPLNVTLVFWAIVMIFGVDRYLPSPDPQHVLDLGYPIVGVLALAAWLAVYFKSTSFVVGADGIHVRWLWTQRFIPYAEIRGASVNGFKLAKKGVILELTRGPALRFPARSGLTKGQADDEAICVVARVREALDLYRRQQRADEVRLPDRGDRPVAEWIRALRSVSREGAVDHRTAPITTEALWQIAEDPGAEKIARASAAVALGARLDAAGRARLRIAAVATAAPDLRAVLEANAEAADEERLSLALSRLTRE